MNALKLTCWNVAHAHRLVTGTVTAADRDRSARIRETLTAIDPDILCLVEGPAGAENVARFADEVLANAWVPVALEAADGPEASYQTRGSQWVWFLVRPELRSRCRLQPPSVWQAFTGQSRWTVHYWGELTPETHAHYRHPQVLVVDIGAGHEIELIGLHLKSKINLNRLETDEAGNVIGAFLTEALQARVKLATEALDVRAYVDAKFAQKPAPGLVLLGDANDGPGRDHFESRYLFFDLVSNLQGDVLQADRFFNHALFDFPEPLRWTARFDDQIAGRRAADNPLLLDHILMSQALCRGELPLVAHAHSGAVEHEAFARANAGASKSRQTSDHRPVSLRLTAS
jgi:hypothetical protein